MSGPPPVEKPTTMRIGLVGYTSATAPAHAQINIAATIKRAPLKINFVDLRDWVMALAGFDDDPKHCGEKILEAIQQAWIDEVA